MDEVFIGSESLKAGRLTRGRLRWQHAAIFPDVYVAHTTAPSLRVRTVGAWLWAGRREPPTGVITRNEKIADDEIVRIGGMAVDVTGKNRVRSRPPATA